VSLKGKKTLQQFRVPLGFLFAGVFLVFAKPFAISLAVGGAIAVIGLLVRAWSAGHIRKNINLTISGPYAHTRNPLYFGSLVMGFGFTVASGVWWLALIFILLFIGIYLPVMRVEADDMRRSFTESYERYAANVPLFFPRLTPYREKDSEKAGFDVSLYLKYREYRAAIGVVLIWAVLAAKMWFLGS
jgi:protein-S-isoprenylcysteine O-methyltransferase Ste14